VKDIRGVEIKEGDIVVRGDRRNGSGTLRVAKVESVNPLVLCAGGKPFVNKSAAAFLVLPPAYSDVTGIRR
jgi:hypothetical protein